MSNKNAKIDENRAGSSLVTEDNAGSLTNSLLVDATTGRLLIACYKVTEPSAPVKNNINIDENRKNVAFGVTDDSSSVATPLAVDSRNGYLFVDLIVE